MVGPMGEPTEWDVTELGERVVTTLWLEWLDHYWALSDPAWRAGRGKPSRAGSAP